MANAMIQEAIETKSLKSNFITVSMLLGNISIQNLSPLEDEEYNLGSENIKWNNVYSKTFIGALTGNASTATKLYTARKINGVDFDGTADITIPISDNTKLPLAGGTMTGHLYLGGIASTAGNSTTDMVFGTTSNVYGVISADTSKNIIFSSTLTPDNSSLVFDLTNGILRPAAISASGLDLGTSTYKWNSVYARDFVGTLDGTANRAIADGSGNTISSTYLKKSGGSLSGDLEINNALTLLSTNGNGESEVFFQNNPEDSDDPLYDKNLYDTWWVQNRPELTGTVEEGLVFARHKTGWEGSTFDPYEEIFALRRNEVRCFKPLYASSLNGSLNASNLTNKSAIKTSEITNDSKLIASSDQSISDVKMMTNTQLRASTTVIPSGTLVAVTDSKGFVTSETTIRYCDLPMGL
jgi:hypothetical protein